MENDINLAIGDRPELKWVDKLKCGVDHNYQREVKPHVVAKILRKFSWSKFGALSLAEQPDGTFSVIDGQHRLEAAKLHPRIADIPAVVNRLDGTQQEANVFLGINTDRTAVTTVERFWAGIEAGDQAMIRIRDVLKRADCEIVASAGPAPRSNMTNSVTAVQRAIDRYGEKAVIAACRTLKTAWHDDKAALNGTMITALSRIFRGNAEMSIERMQAQLNKKSRAQLVADAHAMRKIVGGAAETALSKTLVEIYNRQLQNNLISIGLA